MRKDEKYKVVIREKTTHSIIDSSDTITGYDAWISACIKRDSWKETTDLDTFIVEIIEEV